MLERDPGIDYYAKAVRYVATEDVVCQRCGTSTRRIITEHRHVLKINSAEIELMPGIPTIVCCFCGRVERREVGFRLFRSGGWWKSGSTRR